MKHFLLCVSLVSMIFVVGCFSRGGKRVEPPALNPDTAGTEAMNLYDKNKDGVIKGDELDASPALKACYAWLNKSGNGITAKDIADRIREWQETKTGLTLQAINIQYGGKPVESGTVTLTPEAFLGANYSPATGQINGGTVSPSCADNVDGLSGMPVGFYTVTFEGVPNAPAKMGIEIFDRNPDFQKTNNYTLELKTK